MVLLNPEDVKWIIIHCSASKYGDVETIENWHRERGWLGIGYHFVITGVYPTYESWKYKRPELSYDGMVHTGRSERFRGAHVRGHNWESLGVCLVGAGGIFSSRQLESAAKLCNQLTARFPAIIGVKGHCEFTTRKTCPQIDMDFFRKYIIQGEFNEEPNPIFDPNILLRNGGV